MKTSFDAFCANVRDRFDALVEKLSVSEIEKLKDKDYCLNTFGIDDAVLNDDNVVSFAKWSLATYEYFYDWCCAQEQLPEVLVFVGYGWENNDSPARNDRYWAPIRNRLVALASEVENELSSGAPKKVRINIKRLRASHGEFANAGIVKRIKEADLLVFDVAEGKKTPSKCNENVLYELGYATALDKKPLILYPDNLESEVASFKGEKFAYCWDASLSERKPCDEGELTECLKKRLRAIAEKVLNEPGSSSADSVESLSQRKEPFGVKVVVRVPQEEGDQKCHESSNEKLEERICGYVESAVAHFRERKCTGTVNLLNQLDFNELESADFVIFDYSDKRDISMFYEIGYAHAQGKLMSILYKTDTANETIKMPSDLQGMIVSLYALEPKERVRKLKDAPGFANLVMGLLREKIKAKCPPATSFLDSSL